MITSEGRNETRTLRNGEILALVSPPGEKWRIRSFEHSNAARTASGERVKDDVMARFYQGKETVVEWKITMPPHWAEMRFDSPDEAVSFVENEIASLRGVRA